MVEAIINELKEKLGPKIKNIFKKNDRRVYVDIAKEDVIEFARVLHKDMGARLSIATGLDTFKGFEILYHFSFDHRGGVYINVRALIEDKKNPEIDSLTSVFHASDWIEREMHEMFGIDFKGHPNLKHLLLTDEWDGKYPLRKDFVSEKGLPENE